MYFLKSILIETIFLNFNEFEETFHSIILIYVMFLQPCLDLNTFFFANLEHHWDV